jgi:hypothetical protein
MEEREIIEDMVYQFAYECHPKGGRAALTTGGLSTLESAFDYLGWDDPHYVPDMECNIKGCHEFAHCGCPTKNGYKRLCGKHFAEAKEGII